jgi:DNA (cytosine-5)-methyltransferase 1
VLENVRGLLSHDGGKTFETILAALDDCGYDAEWQVFDGSAYLPQNRERIYIVGLLRGRCAGGILPIRPSDGALDGISEQKVHTLTARLHQSTGTGSYIAYKQPTPCQGVYTYDGLRIRKLTPREYFRLQGFCGYPPFDDTPYERAAAVNSKTQLYKQAGNAVMVPITRAIGERIKEG